MSEESESVSKSSEKKYGLVMNGGGVKGLAFVGALLEFEETLDIEFTAFGGASAGAISAGVLALGYSPSELEIILSNVPFDAFLRPWSIERDQSPLEPKTYKPSNWSRIKSAGVWLLTPLWAPLRAGVFAYRILMTSGLYETSPVGDFLRWLKERKGVLGPSNKLVVVASSKGPDEKSGTRVFVDERDWIGAIRASMAIPIFFKAMQWGEYELVDGGVLDNFPLTKFKENVPEHTAIGMYLYTSQREVRNSDPKSGLVGRVKYLFSLWMSQEEEEKISNHDGLVVRIDVAPIGTVDFGLEAEDKEFLINCGRLAAREFLAANPLLPRRIDGGKPKARSTSAVLTPDSHRRVRAKLRRKWSWRRRWSRLTTAFWSFWWLLAMLVWLGIEAWPAPPDCYSSKRMETEVVPSELWPTLRRDVDRATFNQDPILAEASDTYYGLIVEPKVRTMVRAFAVRKLVDPTLVDFPVVPTGSDPAVSLMFFRDSTGRLVCGLDGKQPSVNDLDIVTVSMFFRASSDDFFLANMNKFEGSKSDVRRLEVLAVPGATVSLYATRPPFLLPGSATRACYDEKHFEDVTGDSRMRVLAKQIADASARCTRLGAFLAAEESRTNYCGIGELVRTRLANLIPVSSSALSVKDVSSSPDAIVMMRVPQ